MEKIDKNKLINLVKNGVFPIVKDINNNTIECDTGFSISGTIQGEGKLVGTPVLFIRTSSCNMRCGFIDSICDTAYSSFHPEKNRMKVGDVLELIEINRGNINSVVISGGEPTMQEEALIELLKGLYNMDMHTTIETNATIFHPDISMYCNLISMSPKLKSSIPSLALLAKEGQNSNWQKKHEDIRYNLGVIQSYITGAYQNGNDFQLKFVCSSREDIIEIEENYVKKLHYVEPSDIYIMPEGMTEEILKKNSIECVKLCIEKGWNFTPRLHINLFGQAKGV